MRFSELLKIELMKYRRSKIIPLIFIAPILVSAPVLPILVRISLRNTPTHGLPCLFRALCSTPTTCCLSA